MSPSLEKWKPVVGYEGLYEVSNFGNLKSLDRDTYCECGQIRHFKGIKLSLSLRNGYYSVNLRNGKYSKLCYVHRLVAEAFISNPKNKPQIDHINTIRTDNRVDNLRWCDAKGNMNNPITKTRISKIVNSVACKDKTQKTREHKGLNKKVYVYDNNGYLIKEYDRASILAKELGVLPSHVNDACRCGFAVKGILCSYEKVNKLEHKYSTKKIAQYTKNGSFIRFWDSIKEAQDFYHVRGIGRACKGVRKTCANYVWKFYKENDYENERRNDKGI